MSCRVGILLPQYGVDIAATLREARRADTLGLDAWIAGQLLPISAGLEKPAFEPLSLMGALAATTKRARLGFMVLAAPYLPPVYLAKALITLDHISGGRLEIGLGAGWREEEFRAIGVPFGDGRSRRERLGRALDALEDLAAGRPTADGADGEVRSGPRGVQSPPPTWIAGRGPRILELVGRRARWANFARGISAEEFTTHGRTVRAAAADAGRDAGPRLSLTGTFLGSTDPSEVTAALELRARRRGVTAAEYRRSLRAANALVGTPGEMADQLAPYLEAGCEAVILWPLDHDHEGATRTVACLRDELWQDSPR